MGIVTQNYIKLVLNAENLFLQYLREECGEIKMMVPTNLDTDIHYETWLTWIRLGVQAANSLGFQVLLLTIADPAWPNFGKEMIKVKLAIFLSFFSMCFYSMDFPKTWVYKEGWASSWSFVLCKESTFRIWLVRKLS